MGPPEKRLTADVLRLTVTAYQLLQECYMLYNLVHLPPPVEEGTAKCLADYDREIGNLVNAPHREVVLQQYILHLQGLKRWLFELIDTASLGAPALRSARQPQIPFWLATAPTEPINVVIPPDWRRLPTRRGGCGLSAKRINKKQERTAEEQEGASYDTGV